MRFVRLTAGLLGAIALSILLGATASGVVNGGEGGPGGAGGASAPSGPGGPGGRADNGQQQTGGGPGGALITCNQTGVVVGNCLGGDAGMGGNAGRRIAGPGGDTGATGDGGRGGKGGNGSAGGNRTRIRR